MSVHVGQQAVVDASGLPVAYELLFRSFRSFRRATSAEVGDGERAAAQVLVMTFLEFGLHDLVGDRLAFGCRDGYCGVRAAARHPASCCASAGGYCRCRE